MVNDAKKRWDDIGCTEEWIKEKLKSHSPGQVTMMCWYRMANYAMEEMKRGFGGK